MFWSKKKKQQKKEAQSAKIREDAMSNVRAAREAIGEETLDRIAAAMAKKQQSATEQAKSQIQKADADRVVDELLFILDKKK